MPVSCRMAGFTKMMYAMVTNVVDPARISVRQLAPSSRNSKYRSRRAFMRIINSNPPATRYFNGAIHWWREECRVLIVMRAQASEQDIAQVCAKIQSLGFRAHVMPGAERSAVGITGNHGPVPAEEFEGLPGVAEAIPVSKPYKLVRREVKPDNTIVDVAGVLVGGAELAICAGPCSVESREQILASARAVKAAGGQLLRGGAYKPRTSPYAFQGLA